MRTLFATLGLVCELVGGFMLSLELIWSVSSFIKPFNRLHKTLLGDKAT